MNITEYYAKREKQLREQWFKDHKATAEEFEHSLREGLCKVMHRLLWAKPGTSNYWCAYIIAGSHLMVYGDIGEAVYAWSDKLTWDFLAGLDLGYFASKCCASESGRHFSDWDEKVAKDALDDHLNECKPKERQRWYDSAGFTCLHSRDEWHHWLHDNGYKVFGDAWYEWAPDIGSVVAWRCQGHLVGLKMAVQSLKAQATQAPA